MAGPFELSLRAFANKANARADATVRETVISFATRVIERSPVGDPTTWKHPAPPGYRPGQFVANWRVGVGAEVGGTFAAIDPGRTVTIDRIAASIPQQAAGKVFYFSNPLPYAWRLEMDGWSHQAPFGFLQITALEFNLIVAEAVQKAKAEITTAGARETA